MNGDNAFPPSVLETNDSHTIPVVSLTEMGKTAREWSLTLYPAHLALAEPGVERPYVILREEVMKSATLAEGMKAFIVTKPRKVTFKLLPEAVTKLADWIGKPVLAGYYLRTRYGWVLPIAVIWMLSSLPISGDSASNVDPLSFDPIGFGLGLALVIAWAFAKWRPHPVLFLVDSIWFLVMAGHLVMVNERSKGWLLLVPLLLWMVMTGVKHFLRFQKTKIVRFSM